MRIAHAVLLAWMLTSTASCTVVGGACFDRDGDGALSVVCGGTDCDDSDPHPSATSQTCFGGAVETCTGTDGAPMITRTPCPRETPICVDGRDGPTHCAESPAAPDSSVPVDARSCGDGVRDPGELCDDGNLVENDGCDAGCDYAECRGASECSLDAPSCADRRPDGTTHCRPALDGTPLGTRCDRDDTCESRFCDPLYHRCSAPCAGDADCGGTDGWCTHGTCVFGCYRESDCAGEYTCALAVVTPPLYFATYCRLEDPSYRRRPGEPCDSTIEGTCAQGYCDHWHGSRCTLMCETDLDCPAVIPRCVDMPAAYGRPPGWSAPARICAPAL